MIGNDIVDLHHAVQHHNWRRPGYVEKVFTIAERDQIAQSQTPDRLVWTLWSVKESAYKLSMQAGAVRKYAPKQIEAQLVTVEDDGVASYSAHYEGQKCRVLVEQTASYVHSVALPWMMSGNKIRTRQMQLSSNELTEQRSYLRQALYRDYATQSETRWEEYSLQKNTEGVPILIYGGEQLQLPLSFSHHGRFGTFAYLVPWNI